MVIGVNLWIKNIIDMLKRVSKTIIEQGGMPLLDYLSSRYTYHGRDLWQELLAEGRILINGTAATEEHILADGEDIC